MIKTKPAKGVKGYIIRTFAPGVRGGFVFRVYDKSEDGKLNDFTDYEILHYDLEVEILDDALFCDNGKRQWIDYDDEILKDTYIQIED